MQSVPSQLFAAMNLRTPINRFPDEILLMIFRWVTYDDLHDGPSFCLKHASKDFRLAQLNLQPLLALTFICKRWRSVAISSPHLWTRFDLTYNTTRAKMFMARSQSLALSLHLNGFTPAPENITTLSKRLRRLDAAVPGLLQSKSNPPLWLTSQEMPQLQVLNLFIESPYDRTLEPAQDPQFFILLKKPVLASLKALSLAELTFWYPANKFPTSRISLLVSEGTRASDPACTGLPSFWLDGTSGEIVDSHNSFLGDFRETLASTRLVELSLEVFDFGVAQVTALLRDMSPLASLVLRLLPYSDCTGFHLGDLGFEVYIYPQVFLRALHSLADTLAPAAPTPDRTAPRFVACPSLRTLKIGSSFHPDYPCRGARCAPSCPEDRSGYLPAVARAFRRLSEARGRTLDCLAIQPVLAVATADAEGVEREKARAWAAFQDEGVPALAPGFVVLAPGEALFPEVPDPEEWRVDGEDMYWDVGDSKASVDHPLFFP
ncbi:uncharacterized protein BXZ73DRAFT_97032 [Epithele typhae]|uniref:uncharacterized protein n=1 Tax=Epithele typhae TaxID=378194 RepID=UPI0020081CFC|nr:uncharacterized protein BXZ73DRAFT_97032 [Epithele typhae]KAH9944550.1 hypothetical protein BXZ73DRAFT_97032 [Epithele typhae]